MFVDSCAITTPVVAISRRDDATSSSCPGRVFQPKAARRGAARGFPPLLTKDMATYVQGQNGTPDAKTLARKARTDSAHKKADQMSQQASARHAFGKACGLRDCKRLDCIEALQDGLVSERPLPVGAPVPEPSRAVRNQSSHSSRRRRTIDATSARWRGGDRVVAEKLLCKDYVLSRIPIHGLISTQVEGPGHVRDAQRDRRGRPRPDEAASVADSTGPEEAAR